MRTIAPAAVAACLLVGTLAPARAASPMTNAFLANVHANLDLLDQSARIAVRRSRSAAVRAYAQAEVAQAAAMADALDVTQPVDRAAASAADSAVLMTGRSVAVGGPAGVAEQGATLGADGRPAPTAADLAALGRLTGRAFDDAFWLKQRAALAQMRADYRAYADDGDDTALSALAERDLPAVERRLAELNRL